MWNIHLCVSLISLSWAFVRADYTITASNELGAYHYPAPPKSQQLYDPVSARKSIYAAPQVYQNQYQGNFYSPALMQQSTVIARQFALPALDNAAFNLALTKQGYKFGNAPAFNAASTASARSSKTYSQTAPVIGSLNVKLPLTIGVTPLNIATLPLEAGTPYASIPNSVTSYGTVYPQRKRR